MIALPQKLKLLKPTLKQMAKM